MNILFIFDDQFDVNILKNSVCGDQAYVTLFPLTSNFLTIEKIKKDLQTFSSLQTKQLESAKLINDEVNLLQKTIHKWSCDLGNQMIGRKKLKEWLKLPDGAGSAWWFGLLSEKNSVQDDAFFKIAQVNAVKKHIGKNSYDVCWLAVTDKKLKKLYIALTYELRIQTRHIPIARLPIKKNLKSWLQSLVNGMGLIAALCSACIHWLVWLRDSREARKQLPSLKNRLTAQNPFLFVTYFPNIDNNAAKKGVFRNKYALALQDKLNGLGIPTSWLVMPVFYNGHNFKSAMQLAKVFIENGEKLFVLQEFFTMRIFLQSMIWWLRQSILSYFLLRYIKKEVLTIGLTDKSALPIIKYLWWHSFVGTSGVRGIIFYLTYKEIFRLLPQTKNCLYYCEMQAWEKALITARNLVSPKVKILAFQHTVVMRNYFNYFYDKSETDRKNKIDDLPLPDVLIANGSVTYKLLSESNYPNLCEAEAIRQLYLNDIEAPVKKTSTNPVLLVVGSYDRNETKSLITMVYSAFGNTNKFSIYFKGSPVNPMEPLFDELGIDIKATNYKILHQEISELLKLTTVSLVANTTVAIEAAVYGCAVIVPIFADTMLMNPIVDTTASYQLANTSEELKVLVEQAMYRAEIGDSTPCVERYWNIDKKLPRWTKLLQMACYAAK